MLTIAGGIVLGALALNLLGKWFGGPTRGERLAFRNELRRREIEAGEAARRGGR